MTLSYEEAKIEPIEYPCLSGKNNRNLRRRLRYHQKKFEEYVLQIAGINPTFLGKENLKGEAGV